MLRSAIARSLRVSVPRAVRAPVTRQIRAPAVRPSQFVPSFQAQSTRFYSAPAGLSKDEVEGRIVNLLKNFDKVGGSLSSSLGILELTVSSIAQVNDSSKVCPR
jgi:NADH dehydrogenase (ubiquinone) 1 alpha/beta subcomplex 1